MEVKIKVLAGGIIPLQQTSGASGFDLHASEDTSVYPGETVVVRCGIAIEVPHSYEAQVRPRSSLSKKGIIAAFGTIDSDYRGEIGVTLTNATGRCMEEVFKVRKGDRIAQLVVCPVPSVQFVQVKSLSDTARGASGFGSTGR